MCVHLCVLTSMCKKMKGTSNQRMHLPGVWITNNTISEPGVFSAKVLQDEWLYHCLSLSLAHTLVLCHIWGCCVKSTNHSDLFTISVFSVSSLTCVCRHFSPFTVLTLLFRSTRCCRSPKLFPVWLWWKWLLPARCVEGFFGLLVGCNSSFSALIRLMLDSAGSCICHCRCWNSIKKLKQLVLSKCLFF